MPRRAGYHPPAAVRVRHRRRRLARSVGHGGDSHGERGRGFAVFPSEIRQRAPQPARAAAETLHPARAGVLADPRRVVHLALQRPMPAAETNRQHRLAAFGVRAASPRRARVHRSHGERHDVGVEHAHRRAHRRAARIFFPLAADAERRQQRIFVHRNRRQLERRLDDDSQTAKPANVQP